MNINKHLEFCLTHHRPSGSAAEQVFVAKLEQLISELGKQMYAINYDGYGNLWVQPYSAKSKVLFTAHTDTVARTRQDHLTHLNLSLELSDGFIKIKEPQSGYVLGADDGAGVALLLHMIEHQVPAHFVFFRDEECGCLGSTWVVDNAPNLLKGFTHAIAFDRRGTTEVLTHQMCGTRCASDIAGQTICDQLQMAHEISPHGVLTDTYALRGHIAECFNIAVGYENEHSPQEILDYEYWSKLAGLVLQVKWNELPVARTPQDDEVSDYDPYSDYDGYDSVELMYEAILQDGFDAAYDAVISTPDLAAELLAKLVMDSGGK